MKKILLLLLSFGVYANAQISPKWYADAKDLKDLTTRTLLVEKLEEDPDKIKKLSKSKKKEEELKDYQNYIAAFNSAIELSVPKYWKLNAKIEFKTKSEIDAIRKTKTKNFAVLRSHVSNDFGNSLYRNTAKATGLFFKGLAYTKIEDNVAANTKNHFPVVNLPDSYINEIEIKYTLESLQHSINYYLKKGKVENFNEFAKDIKLESVSKFETKTLLILKSDFYEKQETELLSSYPNIKSVSYDEFSKAYMNNEKGKAVLFVVPFGVAKSGIGPLNFSSVVFCKVIIDCETGDVISSLIPNMFGMPDMAKFVSSITLKNIYKVK